MNDLSIPKFYPVKLIGLNERSKKIIKYYSNSLLLQEYDQMGRPLNLYQGKPAIFCVSPEGFWNGWFILDEDVRFEKETKNLLQTFRDLGIIRKSNEQ